MRKTLFTFFLAIVAGTGTLFAESGTCGDNLTWDLTDGVLTISGTGAMTDFEWDGAPWYAYRDNITSLTIGNSVTSIGEYAFSECIGLTSVTIPNSVTSIGDRAFYRCSGLTSVAIPNSVISIGKTAFGRCSGLTSIEIPNSVTSIEEEAFSDCEGLTSVVIPNSVTSIGSFAFTGCSALPVENNIRYADTYLVGAVDRTLSTYTIKDGTKWIGGMAFSDCRGLTSIEIPNSVTSIGGGAFDDCRGLTSIEIPNSVTSIGKEAFRHCSGLTSVIIGNSVTNIEDEAFSGCSSVTSVTWNAKHCASPGGFDSSVESFTFGNEVEFLPAYCCYGMNKLTSIEIPNSVTNIGDYAFSRCSGLTSVTIPNGVTSIGDYAFSRCSGLTSVAIPNSVISIGNTTFGSCTGLTSIEIPNSVTSIGEYAFEDCSGLTRITCEAVTPPTCNDRVFYHVDKTIPLYVPAGSVDAYKEAEGWKEFGENIKPIQAAESTVTEIEAEPTNNSVVIAWPTVTGATVYTIQIWKGEELICALSFNGQGQLLSISFEKRAGKGTAKTATQTASGWQYTIGGLEAGTTYKYTVIAKNGEEIVFNESKQFTTTIATAIDEVLEPSNPENIKLIHNGQLFILRDGKMYTTNGIEVK